MTSAPRGRRPAEPAGDALPPDDDLGALFDSAVNGSGAAAAPATGPRADRRAAARPLTAVAPAPPDAEPAPIPPASPEPAAFSPAPQAGLPAAGPASAAAAIEDSPQPGERGLPDPAADIVRQATVLVSFGVAKRFDLYRQQQAAVGQRPSNTEVVFRALNQANGHYDELVAGSQPQPDPGQLFGAPVRGRRPTAEAKRTTQLSFRPTYGESAMIQQLGEKAGATSMSAFVDVVLDAFLPEPKDRGPARRGPAST